MKSLGRSMLLLSLVRGWLNKMDKIYKIDLVFVGITIIALMFLVGYARPLVIAPLDDYETTDSKIIFSIEKADTLFIDDNFDFTTPREYNIKDGLAISLEPGEYYWKAVGIFGSEIRTLKINSKVDLKIKKLGEDSFGVVNDGNVRLNVDVYNGTSLIDKIKIGVGEEKEADGDKFLGGQDE